MTMFKRHMPIWQSIDPIRKHWLTWVVAVDFLYGGINMFGKTESASQLLLASILPIWMWYAMLPLSAFFIAFGYSVRGGMLGTLGWGALAAAAVLTIVHGTALSYGGAIPLIGWAGVHIMITYEVGSGLDDQRERSQRASGEFE